MTINNYNIRCCNLIIRRIKLYFILIWIWDTPDDQITTPYIVVVNGHIDPNSKGDLALRSTLSISPGSSGCSGTTGLSIPSPEPDPLLNATSLSHDIDLHTNLESYPYKV
jgi:hypothetical protein